PARSYALSLHDALPISRAEGSCGSGLSGRGICAGLLPRRVLIAETGPVTERLRVREIDDDEGRRLVRIVRRGSGSVVTWRRAQIDRKSTRLNSSHLGIS